jgi:hypothetical protein
MTKKKNSLCKFNTMEARHPWAWAWDWDWDWDWDWIGYLACQARGLKAFAWRLWNTTLHAVWLYTLELQLCQGKRIVHRKATDHVEHAFRPWRKTYDIKLCSCPCMLQSHRISAATTSTQRNMRSSLIGRTLCNEPSL